MTPEELQRLDAMFQRAVVLPEGERVAYLDGACVGDPALRARVESLLAQDARPHAMLRDVTALAAATSEDTGVGPVPRRVACYRVLDVVGVGGMGVVYRAEQENPRRVVALKLVRPGAFSPEVLRRFAQEGHVLGRLQHPGIAQIFEAGTTDDGAGRGGRQPYFAMEFVEGRPLVEHAEHARLGTRDRVELVARICDALEHAHGKGVVHRDLKPGNVLVQADAAGGVGQPKVLDFGVARAVGSDLATTTLRTDVGQLVGTLPYMSPEQLAGDPAAIDSRCDVYALGVILFELLAGRLPHDVVDRPLPEAARIIRDHEPIRLGTVDRGLRGDLETIVTKALEREPSRRYASAAALAADLRRYLADEPIVARPPTTLYQLRKFARRNTTLVAGVAAVMAVLAVGLAASTVLYLRAEERAEALRRTLYAQRVALAHNAYDRNESEKMARLLEGCPPDLRHWEWSRLAYLADRSVRTFRGHAAEVGAVAFTPDGRRLVATGVYDGATPGPQRDADVRVWDVETGGLVRVLRGHTSPVHDLAISPDGARIATGCWAHVPSADWLPRPDPRILLWDADSGDIVGTMTTPEAWARELAFIDDGRRLVAANRALRTLEVGTGAIVSAHGHHAGVHDMVVLPDGAHVVTVGWEGTLRLAEIASGDERYVIEPDGGAPLMAVAVSPDGTMLATGGVREVVRILDTASGSERSVLRAHSADVTALVFARDGRRLLSGSTDGTMRVWNLDTPGQSQILHGHRRPITDIATSPDGRWVASASADGTVRLWPAVVPPDVVLGGMHDGEVNEAVFDGTGRRIATVSDDGAARIFDAWTGVELLRLEHGSPYVYALDWSPDGSRLVTGELNGRITVWDSTTARALRTWTGHGGPVWTTRVSPDGARVASVARFEDVKIWSVATGTLVRELEGLDGYRRSVVWSPDGTRLIGAGQEGPVIVWRADTGVVERRLSGPGPVLAVDRAGRRLALGDASGRVTIHDLFGAEPRREIAAHTRNVRSISFSPDGQRLVTGGFDQRLHLFDVASGDLMLTFVLPHGASSVVFSPGGDRIAAATGEDLMIWRTTDHDR